MKFIKPYKTYILSYNEKIDLARRERLRKLLLFILLIISIFSYLIFAYVLMLGRLVGLVIIICLVAFSFYLSNVVSDI